MKIDQYRHTYLPKSFTNITEYEYNDIVIRFCKFNGIKLKKEKSIVGWSYTYGKNYKCVKDDCYGCNIKCIERPIYGYDIDGRVPQQFIDYLRNHKYQIHQAAPYEPYDFFQIYLELKEISLKRDLENGILPNIKPEKKQTSRKKEYPYPEVPVARMLVKSKQQCRNTNCKHNNDLVCDSNPVLPVLEEEIIVDCDRFAKIKNDSGIFIAFSSHR